MLRDTISEALQAPRQVTVFFHGRAKVPGQPRPVKTFTAHTFTGIEGVFKLAGRNARLARMGI